MSIYENIGMTSLDYIDEIQRLENELKKHEWISVKDRLPKPFKQVLVYDAFEENITVGLYGNGDWLFSKHITHWMPLPDPPESEGEYHEEVQGIHQV